MEDTIKNRHDSQKKENNNSQFLGVQEFVIELEPILSTIHGFLVV